MKNNNLAFGAMALTVALAFSCAACNSVSNETTDSSLAETTASERKDEETATEAATEAEKESETTEEETTAVDLDLDTAYFKPVGPVEMTEQYESSPEDLEDESLRLIAENLVENGFMMNTADLNAQWYAFDYPYLESEGDVAAYLYRGFNAWNIVGDTQYDYSYYIVTEDILENDLGFTKVSEDESEIVYEPPKSETEIQYFYMDSYIYDKDLGMITASREMYVGGGIG